MKPELQILGWVLTAVVTIFGFVLTRRSATDNTGADLLIAAAKEQREDITSLRSDVNQMKSYIRAHRPWDDRIYDQARAAGWDVEPPPPLD